MAIIIDALFGPIPKIGATHFDDSQIVCCTNIQAERIVEAHLMYHPVYNRNLTRRSKALHNKSKRIITLRCSNIYESRYLVLVSYLPTVGFEG